MKKSTLKLFLVICFCLIISPTAFTGPFDEPGPPLNLKVVDFGGDFVKLEWCSPKDDGGSSIISYWVEVRIKGISTWEKKVKTSIPKAKIIVYGYEGEVAQFRIIAVNLAGEGEPSDPIDHFISLDN